MVSVIVPADVGWRERRHPQRVALRIDVVEQHVDHDPDIRTGLGHVVTRDGRLVRRVDGEQLEDDHGRRLGAVAVDDRVVEPVEADVAGLRLVDDGRGIRDVDGAVGGGPDLDHRDRLAVGVVVVRRDHDRNRLPAPGRDRVVDRHRRVVDAVVVGLALVGRRIDTGLHVAWSGRAGRRPVLDHLAGLAEQRSAGIVLADRVDPPRVDRPDEITCRIVDPDEVDVRGDGQLGARRHARDDIVVDAPIAPVDPDDRGWHLPDQEPPRRRRSRDGRNRRCRDRRS